MSEQPPPILDICQPEDFPSNVIVGAESIISGAGSFRRYYSEQNPGLTIGSHCSMIGAQFSIGTTGAVTIGDYCYFINAVLLCEGSVEIGSHVVIGWNATISDSDFHPLSPADRRQDAIALSPLGNKRDRSRFATKPVIIDDDVYIGPGAVILKGVHVHQGAWIEPGAVVLKDVPPESRVMGNPARID